METENSIKRKECPKHASKNRTKKNQAMQDRDESGLRPSPLAGCRAYRKALQQVKFVTGVKEGSHVHLAVEIQQQLCT